MEVLFNDCAVVHLASGHGQRRKPLIGMWDGAIAPRGEIPERYSGTEAVDPVEAVVGRGVRQARYLLPPQPLLVVCVSLKRRDLT